MAASFKPKKNDTVWENETFKEVDVQIVKGSFDVFLTLTVLRKIKLMMLEYPAMEWAADLIGGLNVDGNYLITDILVYKQDVTSVSIMRTDEEYPPNCVGVIHSHHTMAATFSSVDEDFGNGNNDVNGVICFSDDPMGIEINWEVRVRTSTDMFIRFRDIEWKCDTEAVWVRFDAAEFIADAKSKITELKATVAQQGVSVFDYDGTEFMSSPPARIISNVSDGGFGSLGYENYLEEDTDLDVQFKKEEAINTNEGINISFKDIKVSLPSVADLYESYNKQAVNRIKRNLDCDYEDQRAEYVYEKLDATEQFVSEKIEVLEHYLIESETDIAEGRAALDELERYSDDLYVVMNSMWNSVT